MTEPDLSVKEAARQYDCSPKHVYVLIREGALTSYKIGRITRITRASFEHVRKHGYDRHNPAT